MPRWYALCNGAGVPACRQCRRHVDHHPVAAHELRQGFTTPAFVGTHCNNFMEQPVHASAAITPTDSRH